MLREKQIPVDTVLQHWSRARANKNHSYKSICVNLFKMLTLLHSLPFLMVSHCWKMEII